jgi:hypothetical protein
MARPTSGPDLALQADGSENARDWARAVLATIAGDISVKAAAEGLQVTPQYFFRRRAEIIQAMVAAAEPRPAGRPRLLPDLAQISAVEQVEQQNRIADLALELEGSRIREELRLVLGSRLPQYQRDPKKNV